MGPPPPQLKNSIFRPPRPRDPLQILGRIGGIKSPLVSSKSVVIGPMFGQKTVWPMYALVYPADGAATTMEGGWVTEDCLAMAACGILNMDLLGCATV